MIPLWDSARKEWRSVGCKVEGNLTARNNRRSTVFHNLSVTRTSWYKSMHTAGKNAFTLVHLSSLRVIRQKRVKIWLYKVAKCYRSLYRRHQMPAQDTNACKISRLCVVIPSLVFNYFGWLRFFSLTENTWSLILFWIRRTVALTTVLGSLSDVSSGTSAVNSLSTFSMASWRYFHCLEYACCT